MSRGSVHPAEGKNVCDEESGLTVRQVTAHPSIHHHPFFFVPAWDREMRRLVFVSHRTGQPQIFFEECETGLLVQVTDRPDLAEWSIHPSPDGRFVYFTADTSAWRVDLETFEEEELASFGAVEMREKGMVGAAMGTTALSASGRWWAVPVRSGPLTRFIMIDTARGLSEVFLERDTIGHPQFCPDDEDLILYAGPLTDRVWVTDRSGAKNRRAYKRVDPMQWITHESWIPGRREIAFVDWPRGMQSVHVDTGKARWLTKFPAWHAIADGRGERIVCDTAFPDIGLHVFPVNSGAAPRFLHASAASSEGAHWASPFPYNDGPIEVKAAQHTHPHPRFSPDGTRIVFTSDRSGHAQVYEILLEAES